MIMIWYQAVCHHIYIMGNKGLSDESQKNKDSCLTQKIYFDDCYPDCRHGESAQPARKSAFELSHLPHFTPSKWPNLPYIFGFSKKLQMSYHRQ